MTTTRLEILVEEPSMEAALRALPAEFWGSISFDVYAHQCKQDLLKRLPERLRGYRYWLPEGCRIMVIVDRDGDDCHELKEQLEKMAREAGLTTKTAARGSQFTVINRLVIEELEAWYFGDWAAVRRAYPRVPVNITNRAAYRDPDAIRGGTWEAFERVLKQAGYFKGGLRKIEAANSIVPHFDPDRNSSHSFQVFRETVQALVAGE